MSDGPDVQCEVCGKRVPESEARLRNYHGDVVVAFCQTCASPATNPWK